MFGFFTKKAEKKEIEQLKQAVQTGFNSVKQDFSDVGKWIKHLDSIDFKLKGDISDINVDLSSIKEDLENIKNMISIVGEGRVFKQRQTVFDKQTAVVDVLNSVQTDVQTSFLDNLSSTERTIIFVLLNSDMKL